MTAPKGDPFRVYSFFTLHARTHWRGILSVWILWWTGIPPLRASGVGMTYKSDSIPVPLKVSYHTKISRK